MQKLMSAVCYSMQALVMRLMKVLRFGTQRDDSIYEEHPSAVTAVLRRIRDENHLSVAAKSSTAGDLFASTFEYFSETTSTIQARLFISLEMANPLIEKYNATVEASPLSRKGKPLKKLRRQFFDNELVEIERRHKLGEDVIMLRIWYKEFIMKCGTDDHKVQFKRRTGMFCYIPDDPTRAQRARAEFENFVGDESQASSWHKLFRKLGIDPETLPTTVNQCKKLLEENSIYVNIFDMVAAFKRKTGQVRKFRNFWALKAYSIESGKIFPLHEAKEDSALRLLLQPLFIRR